MSVSSSFSGSTCFLLGSFLRQTFVRCWIRNIEDLVEDLRIGIPMNKAADVYPIPKYLDIRDYKLIYLEQALGTSNNCKLRIGTCYNIIARATGYK